MIRGEELYHRRRQRGWTLEKAAHVIGIHQSTLWRYEMNLVQNIDPVIEERLWTVYWQGDMDHTQAGEESEDEMNEEELLRRYRRLDPRGRRRIQMLLKEG